MGAVLVNIVGAVFGCDVAVVVAVVVGAGVGVGVGGVVVGWLIVKLVPVIHGGEWVHPIGNGIVQKRSWPGRSV